MLRECRRLVKERRSLTNAVKGLLKLHGIFGLQPRAKGFEARFAEVRTAYGSAFPTRARQEFCRRSSCSGVGAFAMAQTRGSPRLWASKALTVIRRRNLTP